jgi:hypothetical protein
MADEKDKDQEFNEDSIRDILTDGVDKIMATVNKIHKNKFQSRLNKSKLLLPASTALLVGTIILANNMSSFSCDRTIIWLLTIAWILLGITIICSCIIFECDSNFNSLHSVLEGQMEDIEPELRKAFRVDVTELAKAINNMVIKESITTFNRAHTSDICSFYSDKIQNISFLLASVLFIILGISVLSKIELL